MTTFFERHKQLLQRAPLWIGTNTVNNTVAGAIGGALGSSFVAGTNASELAADMALGGAFISFLWSLASAPVVAIEKPKIMLSIMLLINIAATGMARPMGNGLRRNEWKWDSNTFLSALAVGMLLTALEIVIVNWKFQREHQASERQYLNPSSRA